MPLSWRDSIATVLVVIGLGFYVAWLVGSGIPGLTEPVGVAIAVLALGVAASISAVVPGFDALLHGSKAYFAAASALGLVAFGAAAWTIVAGGAGAGLAVLVLATVVLWGMSTMRHVGVGRPRQHMQRL